MTGSTGGHGSFGGRHGWSKWCYAGNIEWIQERAARQKARCTGWRGDSCSWSAQMTSQSQRLEERLSCKQTSQKRSYQPHPIPGHTEVSGQRSVRLLTRRHSCPSYWGAPVNAYLPRHSEPHSWQRQPFVIHPSMTVCDSLPWIHWDHVAHYTWHPLKSNSCCCALHSFKSSCLHRALNLWELWLFSLGLVTSHCFHPARSLRVHLAVVLTENPWLLSSCLEFLVHLAGIAFMPESWKRLWFVLLPLLSFGIFLKGYLKLTLRTVHTELGFGEWLKLVVWNKHAVCVWTGTGQKSMLQVPFIRKCHLAGPQRRIFSVMVSLPGTSFIQKLIWLNSIGFP